MKKRFEFVGPISNTGVMTKVHKIFKQIEGTKEWGFNCIDNNYEITHKTGRLYDEYTISRDGVMILDGVLNADYSESICYIDSVLIMPVLIYYNLCTDESSAFDMVTVEKLLVSNKLDEITTADDNCVRRKVFVTDTIKKYDAIADPKEFEPTGLIEYASALVGFHKEHSILHGCENDFHIIVSMFDTEIIVSIVTNNKLVMFYKLNENHKSGVLFVLDNKYWLDIVSAVDVWRGFDLNKSIYFHCDPNKKIELYYGDSENVELNETGK